MPTFNFKSGSYQRDWRRLLRGAQFANWGGLAPPGNFCKKHALCCILVPFLTLHSWFQWIHFVYIIPCLLSLHLFRPSLCFEYVMFCSQNVKISPFLDGLMKENSCVHADLYLLWNLLFFLTGESSSDMMICDDYTI